MGKLTLGTDLLSLDGHCSVSLFGANHSSEKWIQPAPNLGQCARNRTSGELPEQQWMGGDCRVRGGDIRCRQEVAQGDALAVKWAPFSSTLLTLLPCELACTDQLAAAGVRHYISPPFQTVLKGTEGC